jgi:hypothetical protein
VAARRLVIVMLVLLGISTLAAALVDPPEAGEEEDAQLQPPPRPDPRGELVRERIGADRRSPTVIRIAVGDQLVLTVTSESADQVEIPAIGELRFVGPLAPARFDLLAREEGSYAVRLVEADRMIGRIEATARRSPEAEAGD